MKHPVGKGMFVWSLPHCAGGNPIALAAKAKEAGFSWIALKVQDGTYIYNEQLIGPAVEALWHQGLDVWGWGYVYGANKLKMSVAASEAATTVQAVSRYGLSGFLIDAEVEYKRQPQNRGWAATYMAAVRSSLPNTPLGLCSYRYPSLHPEIPWADFLSRCDFHAPQVYWIDANNPGWQLEKSVKELRALKNLPVVPVGAAFSYGKWSPTVAELNQFDETARRLKLPGVSWWSWQHAEADVAWWSTITRHVWSAPPVQEPEPETPLQITHEMLVKMWNHCISQGMKP
jgi:hypothetical protein